MESKRKGGARVLVYVPVEETKKLQALGKDPSVWVRGLVKHALGKL